MKKKVIMIVFGSLILITSVGVVLTLLEGNIDLITGVFLATVGFGLTSSTITFYTIYIKSKSDSD